ncbi:hypothetical protein RSSM_05413 [Rhodopirellula sallentina SM41]|uniref:Uncharacterized protein n=2 Tax=Rhodopirellula TaxID=265488 RepID=M5UAX9_9BACT|nr:hypothetical protein RSSM_05413 [Rhodopirellula sallentina SM41]
MCQPIRSNLSFRSSLRSALVDRDACPMPMGRTSQMVRMWFVGAVTIALLSLTCSAATAQYFVTPGLGYGPRLSITVQSPAVVPVPGPFMGWGHPYGFGPSGYYSSPMAAMADHMARRHMQMAERMSARYGYPYGPAYVEVPPVPGLVPVDPVLPLEEPVYEDPYADGNIDAGWEYEAFADLGLEVGAFQRAAARLTGALSRLENGDVWIEYLETNLLAELAARGRLLSPTAMQNLADRYQGVVANPSLGWLQSLDGFEDVMVGLLAITGGNPEQDAYGSRSSAAEPYSRSTSGQPTVAPEISDADEGVGTGNETEDETSDGESGDASEDGDSVLTNQKEEGSVEILPEPATRSL